MSEKENALAELAKQIPVKDIYTDLLHPALSEAGKGLQGVTRVALAPISGMVWCYDKITGYLDAAIPEYFARRKIDKVKIQSPDVAIAVPAIEALRYTEQKEELREMFVNLLGASMNSDTAELVHPAFVEIIKQLSVDDAICLSYLKGYRKALIDFEVRVDTEYVMVGSNEVVIPEEFENNITSHINNFIRLGIFEKVRTIRDSCSYEFEEVENKIKVLAVEDYIEETNKTQYEKITLNAEYYWLALTEFGDDFVSICC